MANAWWWPWGRRPAARDLTHWQVVMFTRAGCCLCEEAWQQLEQAQRRHGFALSQTDVDGDPRLAELYGSCVPVVQVNGKVRFRGRINPVLLRRLLEAGSG
jgi:hypothetical protein